MSVEKRATREEIFSCVRELLGDDAVEVSAHVHKLALERNYEASLLSLKKYDAKLGGIGIYKSEGKKMTGIYRAFFYVELPFIAKNAEDDSRDIIEAACGYLEALIKRIRRLSLVEKLKDSYKDGIPLGSLLYKVKNLLPMDVFNKAVWLNKKVYVFAKHNYDFGDDENDAPEHYFELDEAVAIYLLVRALGLEIEKIGKVTQNDLLHSPYP